MSKIETVVKKEVNITAALEKEFLRIVKSNIQKDGIANSREAILTEIREKAPKYLREALKLGVDWVAETENGK